VHGAHALDDVFVLVQLAQVLLHLVLQLGHCPPREVPLPQGLPEHALLQEPLPAQLLDLPLQLVRVSLLARQPRLHLPQLLVLLIERLVDPLLELPILRIVADAQRLYHTVFLL
jgi:hypothetical protein